MEGIVINYNKYHKGILEYLKKRRECWHNLFQQESSLVRSFMEGPPYDSEEQKKTSMLAQKAFKKLDADGLIYDETGDGWYSLTPDGEKLLKSGLKDLTIVDIRSIMANYDFHPRIHKVSYKLLADGHFKEAIQTALVEVINRVKEVAGQPHNRNGDALDGDDLMNKAFGCDNRNPLIKLNKLSDSFDKDEQRGFMYLFKGIVGIRNKKAHLNFIQNDSLKAIEYLSFASLLMRLLDDEFINQFNQQNKGQNKGTQNKGTQY